jgi:3,4-dihydroxy 2-butanone 4-phosphate synthase/GTP cyclohydrolase II
MHTLIGMCAESTTRPLPGGDEIRQEASDAVHRAIAAVAAGCMVLLVDDADRENEADILLPAEFATCDQIAFMVRHTTGILCAPMTCARADELALPPMVVANTDVHQTAFTVTVDYMGAGTGVSAADRQRTVAALADKATKPSDLRRPGHVFPLRARPGGVLVRAGHTEAAVDLLRLAGLTEVGLIAEVVAADGSMAAGGEVQTFASTHSIPILRVADLVQYRRVTESFIEQVASSTMPTVFGTFRAMAFRSTLDGTEHLALVLGDIVSASASGRGALVRVHSECLTGDILGSLRCDCGAQLEQAFRAIAAEGCGVVVYLRGHEGRGIGLAHKIRAYALQDNGLDTVDANEAQALPIDSRSYGTGAQILAQLGVRRIRLITNNPAKYGGLEGYAIEIVAKVSLPTVPTPENVRYLRTKRDRMGHAILLPEQSAPEGAAEPGVKAQPVPESFNGLPKRDGMSDFTAQARDRSLDAQRICH